MRSVFLALLLCGCVEETVVIGDMRPRQACDEAITLLAPSAGCTTIEVASTSPVGCLDPVAGRDRAGSWVRLALAPGRAASLHVALTASSTFCSFDGGTSECPASATLRTVIGTPCACEPGTVDTYDVPDAGVDIAIGSSDSEVLLEPLGARFTLSLCGGRGP